MLPYFAIGVFAGLRPSEVTALDWRDVDFEREEIFVRHQEANSKERVGRSVPLEPTLRRWLQLSVNRTGDVTPSLNHRKRFEAIRLHADKWLQERGQEESATLADNWDQDCMRHTAASHWDARTGNRAQTAFWLGHTEDVHKMHYLHPVNKPDAEGFWQIVPSISSEAP